MMSVTKAVLDSKLVWLEDCMRGPFIQSTDNEGRDKDWQKKL